MITLIMHFLWFSAHLTLLEVYLPGEDSAVRLSCSENKVSVEGAGESRHACRVADQSVGLVGVPIQRQNLETHLEIQHTLSGNINNLNHYVFLPKQHFILFYSIQDLLFLYPIYCNTSLSTEDCDNKQQSKTFVRN